LSSGDQIIPALAMIISVEVKAVDKLKFIHYNVGEQFPLNKRYINTIRSTDSQDLDDTKFIQFNIVVSRRRIILWQNGRQPTEISAIQIPLQQTS